MTVPLNILLLMQLFYALNKTNRNFCSWCIYLSLRRKSILILTPSCLSSEYFWLKVNRVHLLDKLRHLSWGWGQPAASARCIPTSPHRSSVRAAAGRGWRGRCWRWGPGQSELVIVVTWPSFLQSQLTWPWRWSSRHSAQNLSTLEMIWIMFSIKVKAKHLVR